MKNKSYINVVACILLFVFIAYISLHFGNALEVTKSENNKISLLEAFEMFERTILESPFIFINTMYRNSYTIISLFLSVITISCMLIYQKMNNGKKKYMKGIEHGSARFATKKEMETVKDKEQQKNIILANDVFLSLNGRKFNRNMNVLVIGGSGSGKTRFFLKPNVMQMYTSVVITDPKGEILYSTGKMLEENGYKVRVLNLVEMDKSDFYNPFNYIRGNAEEDVMTLINTIMINTNNNKSGGGDPFWEKAEMLFLQAIFYYIIQEGDEEDKNMSMVMRLMGLIDIDEEDPDSKSKLDELFEKLEGEYPEHIAVKQYKLFKLSAGKTAKSIVISAAARLAPYNIAALQRLSSIDTLDLAKIGEEKTALFIITSPADTTFNFIASMLYTQLFAVLDFQANRVHGGSLPIPVRFLLDEFANIGKIPNFEKILAYARSLNIGIAPIFQSLSQLKTMYKDDWETIIDNCDTTLFLGGQGMGTLKYFSESLGKTTIDTLNKSDSLSKTNSRSFNQGIMGRELMTPTEIKQMNIKNCIVFIKGLPPYLGKKYKIQKHKNYKLLSDYNKKNTYKLKLSEDKLKDFHLINNTDDIEPDNYSDTEEEKLEAYVDIENEEESDDCYAEDDEFEPEVIENDNSEYSEDIESEFLDEEPDNDDLDEGFATGVSELLKNL